MKRILCVYGTRPEIIKMVSVIRALRAKPGVECRVLNTGQHREMVAELEPIFGIEPDFRFNVMRKNQSLNELVGRVLEAFAGLLASFRPDIVIVQGDTSTVFAVGVACFHEGIPVAHVEAGLRSFDIRSPFPEEFNRKTISQFASYNFAPTERACGNLLDEGVAREKIWVTGNTVIDAIRTILEGKIIREKLVTGKRQILVTAHRRESFGMGIRNICASVKQVLDRHSDVQFLWPVHPNPNVRDTIYRELDGQVRVCLSEPLDYLGLLQAMQESALIWTDSGGIQEEAPTFRKPVLILREVTERPEVVEAGFGRLVGTEVKSIVRETGRLLDDPAEYQARIAGQNPFGDGKAGERIAGILVEGSP